MATSHWTRPNWTSYPLRAGTIGPQQYVYVHHTTDNCFGPFDACLRGTEAMHVNSRNMVNIAYNMLTPNGGGVIADGRGFGRAGRHTLNWNSRANAVCAYGNYENDAPGDRLIEAIADAIVLGIRQGHVGPNPIIGGHRDVFPTACPGRHLYARLPAIRDLVARGGAPAPVPLPPPRKDQSMAAAYFEDAPVIFEVTPDGALRHSYLASGRWQATNLFPAKHCKTGPDARVSVAVHPSGDRYFVEALAASGWHSHIATRERGKSWQKGNDA